MKILVFLNIFLDVISKMVEFLKYVSKSQKCVSMQCYCATFCHGFVKFQVLSHLLGQSKNCHILTHCGNSEYELTYQTIDWTMHNNTFRSLSNVGTSKKTAKFFQSYYKCRCKWAIRGRNELTSNSTKIMPFSYIVYLLK